MATWEGYGVSVRCGALGCYQGTILAADGESITLIKPFRNGFPYPKAQVTLKSSDIKSLEIISSRAEEAPAHSTVLAAGKRRAPRASVGESLQAPALPAPPAPPAPPASQAQPAGEGGGRGRAGAARSQPIDIQAPRPARAPLAGSYGAPGSTPKGRGGDKARRRNEACFGSAALEELNQDFDFEGNLALFDKEALWQQMRPDVVRVAAARDELAGAGAGGKLRHDQNVLRTEPPDNEPVQVPIELRGPVWYVTDGGVRVPSLSAGARQRLWGGLARAAPGDPALTLLARAAADVVLRLVGGTRRLDPRNAHQRPTAGVALGRGAAAAAGAVCARLLAAHGVDTYVIPPADGGCALVRGALAGYAGAGGRVLPGPAGAPAADLLLLALHDPEGAEPLDKHRALLEWAVGARGALVLLEPAGCEAAAAGAGGAWWARAAGAARAALVALLPPALWAGAPRLLLANVAPPPPLFAALGIRYRSPFGAAAVLPLHREDD